jgi:hypothetical protein
VTTYVPVQPVRPRRSRWWWLRYWQLAVWLAGVVGTAARWRVDAEGATWLHLLAVVAVSALLLLAALGSR